MAAMRHRGTILLTGFGPFPGRPENESGRFVSKLANLAARRFSAHRITARVLPTEWIRSIDMAVALYARERPKVALHFGVSPLATGFVLERMGHNRSDLRIDAAGTLPPGAHVLEGGPETAEATWPIDDIFERLRQQSLPVKLSSDAGGYVCNALTYRAALLAAASELPIAMGFVHIPVHIPPPTVRKRGEAHSGTFDLEVALAGGLEIIRVCLGRPPPARPMV